MDDDETARVRRELSDLLGAPIIPLDELEAVIAAQGGAAARAEEIARNLKSIDRTPARYLSRHARAALDRLAARGEDVYVYRPIGADWAHANVWLGPLGHGGSRVTLADWAANWAHLLAEMGETSQDPGEDGGAFA